MAKEQIDLGLDLEFTDVGDDELSFEGSQESNEDALFQEPDLPKDGSEESEETSTDTEKEVDLDETFEELFKEDKNSAPSDSDLEDTGKDSEKSEKSKPGGEQEKTDEELLTVAFARLLEEQGEAEFNQESYLEDVKENGEAQAFLNLVNKTAENKAESFKTEMDSYAKEYVELRESGFSKEDATAMVANKETIDGITEDTLSEDEGLQEDVVREVLRLRKFSDGEIDDYVESLKDTDKLESASAKSLSQLKGYHEQLITHQKKAREEQKLTVQKEQKEYLESLKSTINETDEIIKGKKINQKTKDKLYDMITKPVKTESGQPTNSVWAERSKDPKAFDMKLAYLIHSGIFNGDIKSIATDARSKAVTDLEARLKQRSRSSSGDVMLPEDQNLGDKVDEMSIFLDD